MASAHADTISDAYNIAVVATKRVISLRRDPLLRNDAPLARRASQRARISSFMSPPSCRRLR
ncbi:hypothetical protein PCAR4_130002 [Paraburkholderia caribensis]|nr:hypothetical protein PCAR4_130002 [Paraburkholderia caribensis]